MKIRCKTAETCDPDESRRCTGTRDPEGKVKAGDKVLLGVSKEEIKFSVKSEKALDK